MTNKCLNNHNNRKLNQLFFDTKYYNINNSIREIICSRMIKLRDQMYTNLNIHKLQFQHYQKIQCFINLSHNAMYVHGLTF